jgi:putative ATP-dependent endonuclease of OLD family
MFYPLVEQQIRDLLAEIQGQKKTAEAPDSCVLIDEPELHLHPNLQVKVFDYLRILTSTLPTQVIVATHSPTIVEHASFEELFFLRPTELVVSGENQLVQIASDDERLKSLQEVFGTTSNLTAMQPIVVVEGILQTEKAATISDRKLYRAMNPGFDKVTLLPGGGKSECIRLLQSFESNFCRNSQTA